MSIRVLIVDDQDLVRAGTKMIVDSQDDLRVAGEAATGREAVSLVRTLPVDVVLMDVRMPEMDGIEATEAITALADSPKVIVLTTFDLDESAYAALRAGASGFLLKNVRAEELVAAVRTVYRGDAVIAPTTTRRMLDHVIPTLPGPTRLPPEMSRLTEREQEVLLQVATGASNAEIAQRLFLSETTIKTHVGRLLSKLALRDRVQLAVLAYECGLVRPGR